MSEFNNLTENLFRRKYGEILAFLLRSIGHEHLELAEEAVQDAFQSALEQWPYSGTPKNPEGWLSMVARNKALDALRRKRIGEKKVEVLGIEDSTIPEETGDPQLDDVATMILLCCNPDLAPRAQVALTLKTACGLTVREIGRVLGMNEEAAKKTITRAKQEVAKDRSSFSELDHKRIAKRFPLVMETLYAMFTEGYSASTGDVPLRRTVAEEALYLTSLLASTVLVPDNRRGELEALKALMMFQVARFDARIGVDGIPATLREQDRSKWNRELIARGLAALELSRQSDVVSPYHIEARIAAEHSTARNFEQANWETILGLYDSLLKQKDTPQVRLNRIVALRYARSAEEALQVLDTQRAEKRTPDRFSFYSLRADILEALGQLEASKKEWQMAAELAPTDADKAFVEKKLKRN